MAPFVPDPISEPMNLVVALFLGILFGFVLEQAGFSSSRRLAGLFYGYDFTVLRVFFTAAITAMSGVLLLGSFGYLDLSAIYVNPTWLWPSIAGGAIMGLGFILGGYCPGTSIAAAAIGKIDAMFFVVGGIGGVAIYGEAYPWVQKFADSSSLGAIRVYDSLGVSQGLFAFLLIAVAIAAFVVTTMIEQKVAKDAPSRAYSAKAHRIAGAAALALGLALLAMPNREERLLAHVSNPTYQTAHPVRSVEIDELAFQLLDRDARLKVYDLRPAARFANLTLPSSTHIDMKDLFGRDLVRDMKDSQTEKVFVADSEDEARKAALVAQDLGYEHVSALRGGFAAFAGKYLSNAPLPAAQNDEQTAIRDFILSARSDLRRLIDEARKKGVAAPSKEKKIAGGC